MMDTILATTSSFGKSSPKLIKDLELRELRVITNPYERKITENELSCLLQEHKPIGILAGTEPISREVLLNSRHFLRVISRVGVGWDNVDGEAAKEFGIQVYRTEGVLNQAVGELTVGVILGALRRIPVQSGQVCSGIWKKGMGRLLQGKVVGVVGFGGIGQRVGELVKAFGANIIFYDPVPKEIDWARAVSLENLLSESDIVTIHTSSSEQILGEKELSFLCKPGVIIVNMARGGLVDETALCNALSSGQVACACLDVYEEEPYSGPLTEFENVILTPHIGSYAKEARIEMEKMAVENLLKGLKRQKGGRNISGGRRQD